MMYGMEASPRTPGTLWRAPLGLLQVGCCTPMSAFGHLLNNPQLGCSACTVETFPGAQAWMCSPGRCSVPDCGILEKAC